MEKSGIFHGNFRQKIPVTYKILQDIACNMEDSYKTSIQIFERMNIHFRIKL